MDTGNFHVMSLMGDVGAESSEWIRAGNDRRKKESSKAG
jgi:hypothetical protein